MKSLLDFHRGIATTSGSALLITLAFVILLTVLIVGFLSRSLLEERISASSANQVKSDVFAQGVEATIIGDLEQEIINGSISATAGTSTIYTPKTPANMVPLYDYPSCPTGSNGPSAILANLLKTSTSNPASGSTFPAAANALSTTPSLNGRSVSLSRWSETELIDPSATLPTPNWIMVARDASNPNTFRNTGSTDVTYHSSTKTNSKTVIGRFAYAIYDEGGLLDMNVAGYPTTVATGHALPTYIASTTSYRSGEATADLTQLTSSGSQLLSNAQIDTLIGWRNNASVSPPAPTGIVSTPANLALSNATNYFSFVQSNSTGLLTTGNSSVYNNGSTYSTDQAFTSRYQLIQFVQALYGGGSPTAATLASANTALQYMTHFSRALSQPSFIPALANPATSATAPKTPTSTGSDATWYAAKTNSALGADAAINPSFLTVRVATAFTRNDGSAANVGDPLVKKRFNLNRLAWLTYEGPMSDGSHYGTATSATQVNASNADIQQLATYLNTYYGLSYAFLSQGTAGNIYNYFGLSWVKDDSTVRTRPLGDNQMKWYYNHSSANVAAYAAASPYTALPSSFSGSTPYAGCTSILKLSDVAALASASAREPDFVELLKAGIAAGSKAKAATIPAGGTPANQTPAPGGSTTVVTIVTAMPNNVANQVDTSLSFHLIQIFANIIDQFHLEGYPARIIYCDGSIVPKEFCGVENLPYIYRVRCCNLENLAPAAIVAQTGTATISSPTTHASNPSITQAGAYTTLLIPEIWNPHDQNSPRCAVNPTTGNYLVDSHGNALFPTSFRIVADSIDPDDVLARPGVISPSDLATIKNTYFDLGAPQVQQNDVYMSQFLDASYTYQGQNPWPAGSTGITQMQNCVKHPFPLFADSTSLTFNVPSTASPSSDTGKGFYREPTLLMSATYPANSNLAAAGTYNFLVPSNYTKSVPGGQDSAYPAIDASTTGVNFNPYITASGLKGSDGKYYLGFYYGTSPGAWIGNNTTPNDTVFVGGYMDSRNYSFSNGRNISGSDEGYLTYRVQYNNSYDTVTPGWTSYDTKYCLSGGRNYGSDQVGPPSTTLMNANEYSVAYDPRTYRFSFPHCCSLYGPGYKAINSATYYGWLDTTGGVLVSARPDYSNGYWTSAKEGPSSDPPNSEPDAYGWSTSGEGLTSWVSPLGLTAQNDPDFSPNGAVAYNPSPAVKYNNGTTTANGGTSPQYYADPDGVVRRGTAAFASSVISSTVSTGLPLATANTAASGVETAKSQVQSRPIILHRPFKSVAELGYVFSGTPWKNLDFNTPESGDAALLDLFTLNDTTDPNGLVAGKVNLNTQQVPVLQAILAGAYKDEQASYPTAPNWGAATLALSVPEATKIAKALVARTLSTTTTASQGPLQNVSELVGKYVSSSTLSITSPNPNLAGTETLIDGSKSYAGFTSDQIATSNTNDLTSAFTAASTTPTTTAIQRMRESAIRALASAGQTRVWNLLIDVVAQTGDYPPSASSFDQFAVQGEQRYWIHLAIDRLTGQVIDKQVEVVKE